MKKELFIYNLLCFDPEIKINWKEALNVLVYFLDTLAKEELLKTEFISLDDSKNSFASNVFITSHFTFKGKEPKDQPIKGDLPNITLNKFKKIDKMISSLKSIKNI